MKIKETFEKIWNYLKKDTWDSWLVAIVLVFVIIKFVFFPLLSLATGASLPLVVIESCSLYHETGFDSWWDKNAIWYESKNITKEEFESYPFKGGMNKGDIILVWARSDYKEGDVIIFNAPTAHPVIHRVISTSPIETKGDHNADQLDFEHDVSKEQILGKAVIRIPLFGWAKLIFFEPFRPVEERGFCR
jgi:signal peptidase I